MTLADILRGGLYAIDTPGALTRAGVANLADYMRGEDRHQGWRASGRDVLESMGMDRNRPGLDVGDVAGFGVEMALDPVNWAGGWAAKAALNAMRAKKAMQAGEVAAQAARPGLGEIISQSRAMVPRQPSGLEGVLKARPQPPTPFSRMSATSPTPGPWQPQARLALPAPHADDVIEEAWNPNWNAVHGFGLGIDDIPNPAAVDRTTFLNHYMPKIAMGLPKPLEPGDLVSMASAFGDKSPFAPDSPLMKTMQNWSFDADLHNSNWYEGVLSLENEAGDEGLRILREVAEEMGYGPDVYEYGLADALGDPPFDDYVSIARALAPRIEATLGRRSPGDLWPTGVAELLETAKALPDPLEYAIQVWERAQKGLPGQ